MRSSTALRLAVAILVLACGCTCSTTWFTDCQPDTDEERCIVACPHPNTKVKCEGFEGQEEMACADCCVMRFGKK